MWLGSRIAAPVRPQAWELPYAAGVVLKKKKKERKKNRGRKKKKKRKKKQMLFGLNKTFASKMRG